MKERPILQVWPFSRGVIMLGKKGNKGNIAPGLTLDGTKIPRRWVMSFATTESSSSYPPLIVK